jgi:DNA-binding response OmpR family regulator
MRTTNESPSSELRKPSVLVVDDDASVRLTCVVTLRSDGWNAVGEGSSRRALDRIQNAGEHYDVMVLDYAMPDLDGLAMAAALEPSLRPPTLLASAQADGAVALAALRLGIWDFQAKPLVPDELRRRVRRLHRREQQAAEPKAWIHRALCRCQHCAWAEALRELEDWPEAERTDTGRFLLGLVYQIVGDNAGASAVFRRLRWHDDWFREGAEVWGDLARRLD